MSPDGSLRIALAQINTTVGDLSGNLALVLDSYRSAVAAGADLIVFPELTLTGYPPEDLLLKPSFLDDTRIVLGRLVDAVDRGLVLVGFADADPDLDQGGVWNAAALIGNRRWLDTYRKCALPNYGVFDERRYFRAAVRCPVYRIGPWRLAVNICEDLWVADGPPSVQAFEGRANLMVNLSASPYHAGKGAEREALVVGRARHLGLPIAYSNLVGGQDELVFDGQSLVADAEGHLLARAPQFEAHMVIADLPHPVDSPTDTPPRAAERAHPNHLEREIQLPERPLTLDEVELDPALLPAVGPGTRPMPPGEPAGGDARSSREPSPDATLPATGHHPLSLGHVHAALDPDEEIYRALILGLRDYVQKNGFRGVVIGLSGGIDSALTAVVAADALGPQAVVGISMPSVYSSGSSREGARTLARRLGITFHEIPITRVFDTLKTELTPHLDLRAPDVTEENLQARLRGMLLMAWSNKLGHMVLATGNKSEVAVGYCTLYGDMVGGFSVLKDVLKTQVYRLARWRNERTPDQRPIPSDTISRAPSAELRPDQKDTDTLPPYEVLDPIVRALVEDESSPREIVAGGYDRDVVDRVFRLIQGNEYKRRQAAPGIKITPRAFGKDRRYPLTNRYQPGAVES